jgi:hypothetical protein
VAILTLLSIYRVIAFKVKPDLSSIIEPFSGLYLKPEFNLVDKAFKELFPSINKSKLSLDRPQLLKIETTGPNANKSA